MNGEQQAPDTTKPFEYLIEAKQALIKQLEETDTQLQDILDTLPLLPKGFIELHHFEDGSKILLALSAVTEVEGTMIHDAAATRLTVINGHYRGSNYQMTARETYEQVVTKMYAAQNQRAT
jgi:hypothetical protein